MATRRRGRTKTKARPTKARAAKRRAAKPARAKARTRRPPARARSAARPRDDLRALAQRIIDVTLANDEDATLALYAPDVESTEQGQAPMFGIDSIRQKFAGWRSMVTDARFEPRRVCVDGNTIVIEWVGDVTLAASGRQARLHEVAIHEIEDGRIVREAFFYDPAALA
jgi:ketosteroid isomerase-like protein